jgi:hypothetical protein
MCACTFFRSEKIPREYRERRHLDMGGCVSKTVGTLMAPPKMRYDTQRSNFGSKKLI